MNAGPIRPRPSDALDDLRELVVRHEFLVFVIIRASSILWKSDLGIGALRTQWKRAFYSCFGFKSSMIFVETQ